METTQTYPGLDYLTRAAERTTGHLALDAIAAEQLRTITRNAERLYREGVSAKAVARYLTERARDHQRIARCHDEAGNAPDLDAESRTAYRSAARQHRAILTACMGADDIIRSYH
jgi:hypothetical protein